MNIKKIILSLLMLSISPFTFSMERPPAPPSLVQQDSPSSPEINGKRERSESSQEESEEVEEKTKPASKKKKKAPAQDIQEDAVKRLFLAIEAGNKKLIDEIKQSGLVLTRKQNIQACILASACGHVDILDSLAGGDKDIRYLRSNGGFLKRFGKTRERCAQLHLDTLAINAFLAGICYEQIESVKVFMKDSKRRRGTEILKVKKIKKTPQILACEFKNLDLLKVLGCDVGSIEGMLKKAIELNLPEFVTYGFSFDICSHNLQTLPYDLLTDASFHNNDTLPVMKQHLTKLAPADHLEKIDYHCLKGAVQGGHLSKVRELIPKLKENVGWQRHIYHIASGKNGSIELLKILIDAGVNMLQVFQGIDLDGAMYAEKITASTHALLDGNIEVAEFLHSQGVPFDCKESTRSALELAVRNLNYTAIDFLLNHGVDISQLDFEYKRHVFSLGGTISPAILDENSTDPEIQKIRKRMQEALRKKQQAFVGLNAQSTTRSEDLDPSCNINVQDEQGRSLLVRAIEDEETAKIEWCLKYKVKLDLADYEGRTALYVAAKKGDIKLVERLYDLGAKLYAKDKAGKYVFAVSAAAYESHNNVMAFLHNRAKDLIGLDDIPEELAFSKNKLNFYGHNFLAAFYGAIRGNNYSFVELALRSANGQKVLNGRENPLMIALENGNKCMLRLLLGYEGIKPKITPPTQDEAQTVETPGTVVPIQYNILSTAFEKLQFGSVATLLGAAGDPQRFESELKSSSARGRFYLEKMGEASLASRREKISPLETIKRQETYILIKLLQDKRVLEYLKDPETGLQAGTLDGFDCTYLMLACIFGHVEIVKKLTTMGLPQAYFSARDEYGRTALMYALLYGNTDCALALTHSLHDALGKVVEGGVNLCADSIHLLDHQDRSALFYAIFAATYDHPVQITDAYDRKKMLTKDQYSAELGANKLIDVLLKLGAKFTPTSRALNLAAEVKDQQVLIKVLSKSCMQFQTERCKNITVMIKEC